MKLSLEDLPPPLAAAYKAAKKAGQAPDAIAAFDAHLAKGGKAARTPAILLTLGEMIYMHAAGTLPQHLSVEPCERALALLEEAGLPKKTASRCKDISETIKHARSAIEDLDRMRRADLATLDRDKLTTLAGRLTDLNSPADSAIAARAYVRIATLEKDPIERRVALARAAICFADANNWTEAGPRIDAILKKPVDYDDWVRDFLHVRLLEKAIADRDTATFTKRWQTALAIERDTYFPDYPPSQDKVLAFAVEHGLASVAKHVAAIVIEHRPPADRKALKALVDRANKLR